MKYVVVSSSEWVYPDREDYESAAPNIDLHGPRNSYATAQVLFTGIGGGEGSGVDGGGGGGANGSGKGSGGGGNENCESDGNGSAVPVSVRALGELRGLPLHVYELTPVHVESNPFLPEGEVVRGCPSRWAPFDIYDCLRPMCGCCGGSGDSGDSGEQGRGENRDDSGVDESGGCCCGGESGSGNGCGGGGDSPNTCEDGECEINIPTAAEGVITPVNGTAGIYLSFDLAACAQPGVYAGAVEIEFSDETVVIPARVTVYKATVPVDEHMKIVNGYNREKTSQYHGVEFDSAEHRRLDREYLKMLRRMRQNTLYAHGAVATPQADGSYAFDFSEMERFIEEAIALGYKYFYAPTIGWRESWKKPDINVVAGGVKIPAMSYEAYAYLSQYLRAFRAFIAKKGWSDMIYMGIADEPNEENATAFRALCGMVRKLAPDIKLMDAVSYVPIHGALDCWVPLNSEYDRHREAFESFRGENDEIWHYVCCGPRYEGYINRFMDYPLLSTRYLFWGNFLYNLDGYLHWAANCYQPDQDPFKQNCPKHINTDNETILPSGDTHIIYPGGGGPWMSIRLEAQRHSAEDFELLRLLAQKDANKAGALCRRCFRSFNDVEYGVNAFEAVKKELYEAVSEMS